MSEDIWDRAKRIIPGGTQLLSKRPEQFLPNKWPTYYEYADGISIWDLKGKEYQDFASMGIGSCLLGYHDQDVDVNVLKAVLNGSMSTLNCPEEVELAERLLELHKWADMVRYARTGGEATTIAVRLARAYTGVDRVAFSGYHGWHDWYLSANLGDNKALDEHLLPGLNPLGVPRCLKGTTLPFTDINELKVTLEENRPLIGAIIMEVIRHDKPNIEYLKEIREICDDEDIVLIFDETTSGFRETLGGYHKKIGVNPDLCVFGKGMSNGYPMSAVIGRRDVMDKAQDSFISSTYWSERIGPVASLSTIDKLDTYNVNYELCRKGEHICNGWKHLANKWGIEIKVKNDFLPIPYFEFARDHPYNRTLFIQEMLKRGYLANNTVYVSFAHNEKNIKRYLNNVETVFELLSYGDLKLETTLAKTGFTRLTK